jgi:zinc-ribbon domain
MRCPSCGTENAPGARFCISCGASLGEDDTPPPPGEQPPAPTAGDRPMPEGEQTAPLAPPPGPPGAVATMTEAGPPPPPRRPSPGEILGSGWGSAIRWAVIAFAVLALIGQGLAFLQSRANPEEVVGTVAGVPALPGQPVPQLSGFDIVRSGALTFFQFHNAAIEFDFPPLPVPGGEDPFGGQVDFGARFSATLMLGALAALWLLFLGGRATARRVGGEGWTRPIHGLKIAVPYALLALGYSFLAQVTIDVPLPGFPAGADPPSVGVSILSAVWWPLLFGLLAGAAGGISTGPVLRDRRRTGERRARGVISGGWRMAGLALAFSFAGLLVMAVVKPDDTAAYFELVGAGDLATGASIIIATAMLVPNMSTGITAASMGGSMGMDFFGSSCPLISYVKFPLGATDAPVAEPSPFALCDSLPVEFGIAPIGYFLFLLVPIAATLLGGMWAARRAEAATTGEATAVGAMAGVAFSIVLLGFMLLARITAQVDIPFVTGFLGGGGIAVGPDLLSGTLLAVVWGAAGGALGGLIGLRRGPRPTAGTPGFPPPPPAA